MTINDCTVAHVSSNELKNWTVANDFKQLREYTSVIHQLVLA